MLAVAASRAMFAWAVAMTARAFSTSARIRSTLASDVATAARVFSTSARTFSTLARWLSTWAWALSRSAVAALSLAWKTSVSIRAISCPRRTGVLKSTRTSLTWPDTWLPT